MNTNQQHIPYENNWSKDKLRMMGAAALTDDMKLVYVF